MTRAEHCAALNRTPEHRARVSAAAVERNAQSKHREGKFKVDDETIAEMARLRASGLPWGTIGPRFNMSASGARNRVLRRVGNVMPRPVTFACGHSRDPENVVIEAAFRKARCRTCNLAQKRRWRERQKEIRAGDPRRKTGPAPKPRPAPDGVEALTPEALGSRNLLVGMLKYGARHGGIPRMSAEECRDELRRLAA